MKKRNIYLKTTSTEDALEKFINRIQESLTVDEEIVPVTASLGRVSAKPVFANYSSPMFNSSAMDGIAVKASTTFQAKENNPVTLIKGKDYIDIDTGDPISNAYDAVIMIEDLIIREEGKVDIISPAIPWQHIRPIGEDIVAGELIVPTNHEISPIDISVLLSSSITEISVIKKPIVTVIPTGDEIIEPGENPKYDSIFESNSRMLENLLIEDGATPNRIPPVKDEYNTLLEVVQQASKVSDMILLNAGSSAGRDDYSKAVIETLGEVLIHGVAIKPGKPVILGMINDTPIVGIPGYPVSAYISYINFVKPVLRMFTGKKKTEKFILEAYVSNRIVSSLNNKEYVRVKLGKVGEKIVASPLARGAGAAMSLVRSDGFLVIDQLSEGVEAGDLVQIESNRRIEEMEKTIVIIGSHDMSIDIINDILSGNKSEYYISSSHVGSVSGLMALKRGEAHIAPIHLLEPENGKYNEDYVKRLFEKDEIVIVKGIRRRQGLIVKKGNPLNIKTLKDINGHRFVNRQRGAGTRILFDYLLEKENISPETINGYSRQMTTHMSVCAAIKSDSADVGMGIESAARIMDLDYIHIADEEYDFAIHKKYIEDDNIKAFLKVLNSSEFKERMDKIGGYSYENIGEHILP